MKRALLFSAVILMLLLAGCAKGKLQTQLSSELKEVYSGIEGVKIKQENNLTLSVIVKTDKQLSYEETVALIKTSRDALLAAQSDLKLSVPKEATVQGYFRNYDRLVQGKRLKQQPKQLRRMKVYIETKDSTVCLYAFHFMNPRFTEEENVVDLFRRWSYWYKGREHLYCIVGND